MNKLKSLREEHNYSYQHMANKLCISKPFYWQIENNQRRLSYDMAVRIADVFHMMPDEIFYNDIKKISSKQNDTSL